MVHCSTQATAARPTCPPPLPPYTAFCPYPVEGQQCGVNAQIYGIVWHEVPRALLYEQTRVAT